MLRHLRLNGQCAVLPTPVVASVTTAGLSLSDNSLNLLINTFAYTLNTTMLKALMDNSTTWGTAVTDISNCMKLSGSNDVTVDINFFTNTFMFCGAFPTEISHFSGVSPSIKSQLVGHTNLINIHSSQTAQMSNIMLTKWYSFHRSYSSQWFRLSLLYP